MKNTVLVNIDKSVVITDAMRELSEDVEFIEHDGNNAWFESDGIVYGVDFYDEQFCIMDFDGIPMQCEWVAQNYELVEVLKAAYKTHAAA